MNKHKYLLGVFLILIGIILLLGSLGIGNFSIWDMFHSWWPLIIIFFGVKEIVEKGKHSITSGSIWLLIGLVLQANQIDLLPLGFWATFWPLFLILIGVLTIIKRNKNINHFQRPIFNESELNSDENVSIEAIFSGVDRYVESQNLKSVNVSTIFSGVKLDLRGANLSEDFNEINVNIVFGGLEILVPFNWQIVANGSPIFGGYEDKTRISSANIENKRIVNLKYEVVFGGLELKN